MNLKMTFFSNRSKNGGDIATKLRAPVTPGQTQRLFIYFIYLL